VERKGKKEGEKRESKEWIYRGSEREVRSRMLNEREGVGNPRKEFLTKQKVRSLNGPHTAQKDTFKKLGERRSGITAGNSTERGIHHGRRRGVKPKKGRLVGITKELKPGGKKNGRRP